MRQPRKKKRVNRKAPAYICVDLFAPEIGCCYIAVFLEDDHGDSLLEIGPNIDTLECREDIDLFCSAWEKKAKKMCKNFFPSASITMLKSKLKRGNA